MELPPPAMKQQVRNLSVQQDINVLRGTAASDAFGPRFAALQALREFMEGEQRKTRRRLVLLAAGLGMALLLLVLAGWLVAARVSNRSAAGQTALQSELAEARKDVQNLRRDVEARWTQDEAGLAALQRSLAEARAEFETMRGQLASALQGVEGASASPLLALVQELQVLRSEQWDLEVRQTQLQHEMGLLEEGQRNRAARRAELARARDDLAGAVADFTQRQQEAEGRLQNLGPAPASELDARAAVGRSRKAAPSSPAAGSVVEALEQLYTLRSEQLDLKARHAQLQRDLDALEAEQRLDQLRQQRVESVRTDLAGRLEAYLGRQRDLQQRLESLRAGTGAEPAQIPADLMLDLP